MPKSLPLAALLALPLALFAATSPADGPSPRSRDPYAIIAPDEARQGDPLLVWIVRAKDADGAGATKGQRLVATLRDPAGKSMAKARCFQADALLGEAADPRVELFGALFALSPKLPPASYLVAVGGAEARVSVGKRDFPVETVKLNATNTKTKTVPTTRKAKESDRLGDLLATVDDTGLYADCSPFLFPVKGGFLSASFGEGRRYLYSNGRTEQSFHAGIDWGVVVGTPVMACERGKVVLAADRSVTGKTLVVEHLPGLYSMYYHLSSFEAKEGDIVERGQAIARSGSSGVSTGPHLHWELRARGEAVDPERWLGRALLDKDALMATITALIEGR